MEVWRWSHCIWHLRGVWQYGLNLSRCQLKLPRTLLGLIMPHLVQAQVFALHTNGSMFSWGYDYYELVFAYSDFKMHGLYNMGGNWLKIAHSGYGDVICGLRADYKIM